jgi:hypothetical protein
MAVKYTVKEKTGYFAKDMYLDENMHPVQKEKQTF